MGDQFISRSDAEKDLLAAAAFLAENIKSADGHAEAMKSIIPLYLAKGDVDLAAELANQIDEPFSRDKMLILVAENCAEADDDDYAVQLADAIEDDGLRAQAMERVALVKVAKGELDKASEFAAGMAHPDRVLSGMAVRHVEQGNDDAAEEMLSTIEFPTARVSALLQMANVRIDRGEHVKAADAITEATVSAREIEHDEEKIRSLCDAGNLFIEAKRSDLAVATFDEARELAEVLDNVHRDIFLGNCALGFELAGSEEMAERALDLVTDKTEMASALLAFARVDWRKDNKEDAIEELDEAYEILRSQREFETRDGRARNTLMTNVAVQFAGFGKTEKAIEIAQTNLDPEEEMSGFAQIAQMQVMLGEEAAARETLGLIREDANRLFALISVSDSEERAGKRDAAIELLNEAATFAEGVPQHASRSSALNDLAHRFAHYGLIERAREIGLENLDLIAEIRDESSRAAALAGLANVYDEAGLTPGDGELAKVGLMIYRIG